MRSTRGLPAWGSPARAWGMRFRSSAKCRTSRLRRPSAAGHRPGNRTAWYEKATSLQPENPDTWYDLGLYLSIVAHDQCAAYAALNHSYTLDPSSKRWVPGGPLDVARDAVNDGACER